MSEKLTHLDRVIGRSYRNPTIKTVHSKRHVGVVIFREMSYNEINQQVKIHSLSRSHSFLRPKLYL